MFDGKRIQRYHFAIFGGKRQTAIQVAVANIANRFGLAHTRAAVIAHIARSKSEEPASPRKADVVPSAPVGKEFYESWGWKEARFAALKRHGRQCQCCGWTPGTSVGNHLVVDHIKPIRTHPHLALDPENHQVLCNDCNMGKSFRHHDDFR